MISLRINGVPTLFIKAYVADNVRTILQFVRGAAGFHTHDSNDVLFIDTPITAATVEAVERLLSEGFRVFFRDHHAIDGDATNDRERQVVAATSKLQSLLGDDCRITVRRIHPACSTLVDAGEFKHAVAIIADPDADGLTAAMKAAGITYDELDSDAALLDSEPQVQVTGSPISQLLAKGLAVIPSYDASRPKDREVATQKLFSDWVKAVEGDGPARLRLQDCEARYERAVEVSRQLASKAKEVAPGVVLVDAADSELYDPGTLNAFLEKIDGCRVSVVRKSLGPIAALHGIQYSLAVPRAFQNSVDLRALVPTHSKSDPDGGVISNLSFLLHVSESVWLSEVLPRLQNPTT